jgi:hypothetical protein
VGPQTHAELGHLAPGWRIADKQVMTPAEIRVSEFSRRSEMPIELATELGELLLAGRNPDGGWAYYNGKASRLEPTCWALLSLLGGERPEDATVVNAGLRLIGTWQRANGLIAEPRLPPNLAFNGLASLVFTAAGSSTFARPVHDEVQRRLLAGVAGVRSTTAWNWNSPVHQDNSLVGWPWTEGAFGWVEPTAWCMLALKKYGARRGPRDVQGRIDEAERLLLDRQCAEGGWNYGNSEVLERKLHAYVPTTALVLLALQNRRGRPEVRRGLDYLLGAWPHEPAGLALGMSLLCFRAFALPTVEVEAGLTTAWQKSEFLGNYAVAGMARYALTTGMHGPNSLAL